MHNQNRSLEDIEHEYQGDIILPGSKNYDEARATFLHPALVDGPRPAVIFRPKHAVAVAQAIHYARDNNLVLSIRSGGHSNAGHSTNEGGVIIDLTLLRDIAIVDETKHLLRIGAGAHWGDVAQFLQPHGLALSSGDTKSVGVGGLTLGGGIGWMVRKYGLTIDSLVAAEMVTAQGEVVRADAETNPDLFWALRGGGGNFGVVTAFEFVAHPTGKVLAGSIAFRPDDLSALLGGWRDYMRTAPDELTTTFLIMPSFGGEPPCTLLYVCWSGDKERGEAIVAQLQLLGTVVNTDVAEKDYAGILEDARLSQGMKVVVHNTFVPEITDELITVLDEAFKKGGFIAQIRSLQGACGRIPADATAFAHRGSEALLVVPTFMDPKTTKAEEEVLLSSWHKVAAFGKGAYANFLSEATEKEVAAIYPPATYRRLAKVKKQYDPNNIFNQNYNIKPSEH